jgi:hypothetical protein
MMAKTTMMKTRQVKRNNGHDSVWPGALELDGTSELRKKPSASATRDQQKTHEDTEMGNGIF